MAGITGYTRTDHIWAGMVGKCIQESLNRMTGYAVRVGDRVSARWDVGGSRCHADGRNTVVTVRATTCNTRMIKAAARAQIKKADGIVAVVALGVGR